MLIHQGLKPSPTLTKNHDQVSDLSSFSFHELNVSLATTVQDVRLELIQEEAHETAYGVLPPHKISASSFLTIGLELEEQQ